MKTMLRIACLAAPVMLNVAQASTLQPGNLIIGSDLTYPPYNFLKQDKPAGFDTEFIELIASPLKLKPVVKDTRFASLILGLKAISSMLSLQHSMSRRSARSRWIFCLI
nr:cystine transporter subunit [Klebsiella pneumoniae]